METQYMGLILNPPESDHWYLGSGLASEHFGGEDILPSGDWMSYKMADELQKKYGFDTFNCTNYGEIKAWLMAGKLHGYTGFLQDASERYTGVHTGTVPGVGNDPHHVGEVIRKECGLIPEASMPWTSDIDTPEKYYNRTQAMANLPFGKKLLDRYTLGHEWVFGYGTSSTPKEKAELIKKALKRGPVCISVKAWEKQGKYYVKKPGEKDTHWLVALRYNGSRLIVHDQYEPFIKTLAPEYDFNAAKVYFLKEKQEEARNLWSIIWDNFKNLWKRS